MREDWRCGMWEGYGVWEDYGVWECGGAGGVYAGLYVEQEGGGGV